MPTTPPDLRRLRVDVCTAVGTYASGTLVTVLGGRRTDRRIRVCFDPPGAHMGRCHQAWLHAQSCTRRALVGPQRVA